MRILLTGAAGFIGSNLLASLLTDERVTEAYAVDDFSNGRVEFLPEDVKGACRDVKKANWRLKFNYGKLHFLDASFDSASSEFRPNILSDWDFWSNIDAVVHLAAMPRVPLSVENPELSFSVNLAATQRLLNEIVRSRRDIKFVFASSSAVYGDEPCSHWPSFEHTSPKSPYALHKLNVEQHLALYAELYGLDSIALRFFNVYGKNQVGGSPYSTAISAWLRAAYAGERPKIYGDGSHSRDLIHVDDVVSAVKAALFFKGDDVKCHRVFNVGTGESHTNREVLDNILSLHPMEVEYFPPREGDALHTLADISETTRVLGWEPTISIERGIMMTDAWYKENWAWISKFNMKW